MKKVIRALSLLGLISGMLLFMNSCKKDNSRLVCLVNHWQTNTTSINFSYDDAGFVKRMWINSSGYLEYTQSGNRVTRQNYDSTGTPTGSSAYYYVNSAGYYSLIPGGSDSTFISYNGDGQMTEFMRRDDTLKSRSGFTFENGDAIQMVSYGTDSAVTGTTIYEYYTERVNNSNLNLMFDLLDSRYGKPNKHFVKSSTESKSGNITYTNFSYTFDDNGNVTHARLITQPSNHVTDIDFTYQCN